MTAGPSGASELHRRCRAVVLGLGNVLCADDGVGVFAVHRLRQRYVIPGDVLALDGGTLGLSLLPHICGVERLLILDAVSARAAPGTLLRFAGDAVGPALRDRLSVHQVGVADLLLAARWLDRSPARVALLGVVAASTELGLGLSAAVEAQLPSLVRAVAAELDADGVGRLAERCPVPDEERLGDSAIAILRGRAPRLISRRSLVIDEGGSSARPHHGEEDGAGVQGEQNSAFVSSPS